MDKNFESNNKKKNKNIYQQINDIKKNYLNYKSFMDYQNDEKNNFLLNGRKNKNVNKKFIRNYNDLSNYAEINFNSNYEIPKYRTKKNFSNLNILELNKNNDNFIKREKLKNEILNTLNAPQNYFQKQNYSLNNSPLKQQPIGISGVNFF